jgi:hypothetical protein
VLQVEQRLASASRASTFLEDLQVGVVAPPQLKTPCQMLPELWYVFFKSGPSTLPPTRGVTGVQHARCSRRSGVWSLAPMVYATLHPPPLPHPHTCLLCSRLRSCTCTLFTFTYFMA